MDAELRRLERQAALGDPEATQRLSRLRARLRPPVRVYIDPPFYTDPPWNTCLWSVDYGYFERKILAYASDDVKATLASYLIPPLSVTTTTTPFQEEEPSDCLPKRLHPTKSRKWQRPNRKHVRKIKQMSKKRQRT